MDIVGKFIWVIWLFGKLKSGNRSEIGNCFDMVFYIKINFIV